MDKMTPEKLLIFMDCLYDYCVVEKKSSIFKKMLKLCEIIGFDEELVGCIMYDGLVNILEDMVESDKGE